MARRHTAVTAALAVTAVLAAAAETRADDFYKNKQIRIISSTGPGVLYDLYSRLLARHMGRHIPGNPTVIVSNMVGAGGVVATNYVANVAPRDGTVLAGPHSNVPTAPLTTPDVVKFDANKLSWIGSITKEPLVAYVWHTAPVKVLADLKTQEVTMGGTSAGAAGVDIARLAIGLFDLKIKLVAGYKASSDVRLAMERGEVHGTFGNSWGDLQTTSQDWIKEGKVRVIGQHSLQRHHELQHVPLLIDLATTEADRQAVRFALAVRQEASKPYLAPPDIPAERLAILRHAFEATMKDPQFLAEAAASRLPVDGPLTGAALAALVAQIQRTPEPIVERVLKMIAK
jgi:tripartite-type tricarboxylate transporter receptor subunit TctC